MSKVSPDDPPQMLDGRSAMLHPQSHKLSHEHLHSRQVVDVLTPEREGNRGRES